MTIRVIPRLDIKGPNLVKGVHFEGLRVLGKPERFARLYYEQGADELIYLDTVASLYGRNSLVEIIKKTAREIFIPLTVGGGLRTLEDMRTVLRAGADKILINTAAIERPALIRDAARAFGSSTIVVSIEAIRNPDGTYEACTDYGRQSSGLDAVAWAAKAVELGAGELSVASIDNEGTGRGYDIELTRAIAGTVPVPVIAGGGAGSAADVCEVVTKGQADAVSIASILHYNIVRHFVFDEDDFNAEGNIEFLKRNGGHSAIADSSLAEIKLALHKAGVRCRWEGAD